MALGANLLSEEIPTIEFDYSKVSIENDFTEIHYEGLKNNVITNNITLPYYNIYIAGDRNLNHNEIKYHVTNNKLVFQTDIFRPKELPTSDNNSRTNNIISNITKNSYGSLPLEYIGVITIDNSKYYQFMVFPFIVDNNGNCYFNENINITNASEQLFSHEIKTYSEIFPYKEKNNIQKSSLSSGEIEYLIITSIDFIDEMNRLAKYKSSTGTKTQVEDINEILKNSNGIDDSEKLREYLKEFYNNNGKFVLLAGDETIIPIRYAYNVSAISPPSLQYQQVCDLYYADLTGDWDSDNDGVWGEAFYDNPDIVPELRVGRLPFNTKIEFQNYIDKLITYETNPGNGDYSYLSNSFFISADQMRDYESGQHTAIAQAFPENFYIDTINGVEASTGYDPQPFNLTANELESVISGGYGIVNILTHGSNSSISTRTSGYNNWPKSYFSADSTLLGPGHFSGFDKNNKISFYYSLACDNGGFDLDQPPMERTRPNVTQTLLGQEKSGAVGMISYSRWGWIRTSYQLQKAFFDSLFANPNQPAIDAMYDVKLEFAHYRDLVYGQNFFGDPTLKVYTNIPKQLNIVHKIVENKIVIEVKSQNNSVNDVLVTLSDDGIIISQDYSNDSGIVVFDNIFWM